jgi:hypothetical protein
MAEVDKCKAATKPAATADATAPTATEPAATAPEPTAPAATAPEATAAATAPAAAAIASTDANKTTTATETAATTTKKKKKVTILGRTAYPRLAAKLFKTPSKEQEDLLDLNKALDPMEVLAKGKGDEALTRRNLQGFAKERARMRGTKFEAELTHIASFIMTAQSFVGSYHYDFVNNLDEQYDSANQFDN